MLSVALSLSSRCPKAALGWWTLSTAEVRRSPDFPLFEGLCGSSTNSPNSDRPADSRRFCYPIMTRKGGARIACNCLTAPSSRLYTEKTLPLVPTLRVERKSGRSVANSAPEETAPKRATRGSITFRSTPATQSVASSALMRSVERGLGAVPSMHETPIMNRLLSRRHRTALTTNSLCRPGKPSKMNSNSQSCATKAGTDFREIENRDLSNARPQAERHLPLELARINI